MDQKAEGVLAIVAALIVLLSAMWDPRISVAVSTIALAAFGVSKLLRKSS